MRTAGSRRMRARALLAVAAAASLALAGCAAPADPSRTDAPADAAPDTTTTPSPTALTEEEALAIAVETFEKFLYAEREVMASGGANTDEIKSLSTENMNEYIDELVSLAESDDFTVEGDMSVVEAEPQSYSTDEISFYVCVDLADSKMYDSTGAPLGNEREGIIQAAEVHVIDVDGSPRVDGQKKWPELELCQ